MSYNHPNYDSRDLVQLREYELARIQADTSAIRSRAQNDISTTQKAQAEDSARQDRRLNAEIARLDTESQRSIQRADNESNARIQIQRDEMKSRQEREDLMAKARLGSDASGKNSDNHQWGCLWKWRWQGDWEEDEEVWNKWLEIGNYWSLLQKFDS